MRRGRVGKRASEGLERAHVAGGNRQPRGRSPRDPARFSAGVKAWRECEDRAWCKDVACGVKTWRVV